jgi:hypothetical protein
MPRKAQIIVPGEQVIAARVRVPWDDRLIVPKRKRDSGWTINLGHPHGHLALCAVWAAALLPLAIGLVLLASTRF